MIPFLKGSPVCVDRFLSAKASFLFLENFSIATSASPSSGILTEMGRHVFPPHFFFPTKPCQHCREVAADYAQFLRCPFPSWMKMYPLLPPFSLFVDSFPLRNFFSPSDHHSRFFPLVERRPFFPQTLCFCFRLDAVPAQIFPLLQEQF